MANINSLPDEILLRIFEYYYLTESQNKLLRNLSQVCRKWEEVSKDSYNFQTVDGSIPANEIISLAKAGSLKKTKSLTFGILGSTRSFKKAKSPKSKSVFDNKAFENFYANLPRLKSLYLGNVCSDFQSKKEHSIFTELKDFCPDLCELILGHPKINCKTKISSTIFEEFLSVRGPKLVTLDFSHVNISSLRKVILIIAKRCPNLETLIIQDMTIPTLDLISFPIEQMQAGCPKLKTLRFTFPITFREKFNPKTPGFPQLETFTYPYRDEIHFRDELFLMLLSKSPNLQILDIRGCQKLSVEAVHSLPATDLEQLYISRSNVTQRQEMFKLLQKWCHSLRIIDLSHTTKDFLNEMAGSLFIPNGLPKLENLDLSSTIVRIHTLKYIIQHCPKLSYLNLQLCRSLERKMRRIYTSRNEIEELLKHEEIDIA